MRMERDEVYKAFSRALGIESILPIKVDRYNCGLVAAVTQPFDRLYTTPGLDTVTSKKIYQRVWSLGMPKDSRQEHTCKHSHTKWQLL